MAFNQEEVKNCTIHCENILEFFCPTCKDSACKDCKLFISCYKNRHDIIPIRIAVDEFNQQALEAIKISNDIKQKLEDEFNSIFVDKSDFESHINLCKTAIEIQTKVILEMVKEKSNGLILDLKKIHQQKNELLNSRVQELESKQMQVQKLMASVTKMMNKPEEKEKLVSDRSSIDALQQKILETTLDKSCHKRNLTPSFIPFINLEEVLDVEGIGKLRSFDNRYATDEDDQRIIVTKGQPFVVKVSRLAESGTCQLSATLRNSSGEESATEIEDQGNGEYRILSRCDEEGEWQMRITAGVVDIKGSPVNIHVEPSGFLHTICEIEHYNNKEVKYLNMYCISLDANGSILVSTNLQDILKFNKKGKLIDRLQAQPNACVGKMRQMADGNIVYSDYSGERVVMCDDQFQGIRFFGEGVLKNPKGMAVNLKTRVLYVVDREIHCVFKFNLDDRKLLGKIGQAGKKDGQLRLPYDVAITEEGNVIVADFGNSRIQMFDENGKFIRILVDSGEEEGKVLNPCYVLIDVDGNIIVSGYKLQLFDKNGVFIKRIDHKNDGLCGPLDIVVISNRPRRLVVGELGAYTVKMFNY